MVQASRTSCPRCGAGVKERNLKPHLRGAHGVVALGLSRRQLALLGSVVLVLAVGAGLLLPRPPAPPASSAAASPAPISTMTLVPVERWLHTHGLAVDPLNPDILYVGTHGLGVVRGEGGKWYRVGDSRLDLMGYSSNPSNGSIHLSSGHPPGGGNLGVVRSDDGGATWRRVDTLPRQVDFHAMAVSPADPRRLYAWYYGDQRLYLSRDAGVTWTNPEARGLGGSVVALAGDPRVESRALAVSPEGIYETRDAGASWTKMESEPAPPRPIALAIDPRSPDVLYLSDATLGLLKSTDGGRTWKPSGTGLPPGDPAFQIAVAPGRPDTLYAGMGSTAIYRSTDGGAAWGVFRSA